MSRSVVVFGPLGCGKTLHADRFMKAFGLTETVDLEPGMRVKREGVLYFAVVRPPRAIVRVMHFDKAMQLSRGAA